MARKKRKKKWGKIGAPKSAKRRRWLSKIGKKGGRKRRRRRRGRRRTR